MSAFGQNNVGFRRRPPPEYGSLISLSNDDADAIYVSCSNKEYQLVVSYGADAAPPAIANPRIRIEVDNNYWIEGDTKINDNDIGGGDGHWILLTSYIGPKNLDVLSRVNDQSIGCSITSGFRKASRTKRKIAVAISASGVRRSLA